MVSEMSLQNDKCRLSTKTTEKNTMQPTNILTCIVFVFLMILGRINADMSNGQVIPSNYPSSNTYSFGKNIKLYWKLWQNPSQPSVPVIEFGMICKKAGYCSLGFDHDREEGMDKIDTVFATMTKGVPSVVDAYCASKSRVPVVDTFKGGTNDYLETNGGVWNSEYHYKVCEIVSSNI